MDFDPSRPKPEYRGLEHRGMTSVPVKLKWCRRASPSLPAHIIVIPAQAGIQLRRCRAEIKRGIWIPACAGMTKW